MMNFRNKTFVITGGNRGIGAACTKALLEAGARVAVFDLDPEGTAMENLSYYQCDVSNSMQVQKAMQAVANESGSIYGLINNAGIQRYGTVADTDEADWDLVMNVNLKSYFLCSKYAVPQMLKNEKGVIINISSVQAFVTQDKVAAYATAKTAILGLTRSIAIDFAPRIRCVAVCPGTIDTPMLRDSIALSPDPDAVMQECVDMHLANRIGNPEEVAALVKFLCSDEASFITGETIRVDGGLGIKIQGSKKD